MIKLYNSLTRKKEEFKSIEPNKAKVYSCGPTVYNFAHIGNLRSYIFADVLKRTLQYNKYTVDHIINITDVGHLTSDADEGEDKMMKALRREGLEATPESMMKIANSYTEAFKHDLEDLNILFPTKFTKATDYILYMTGLIERLIEKGYTYQTKQAIYFDVSKFPEYKDLFLGQDLDKKKAAREDVGCDEDKKHPADFALWFFLCGDFERVVQHWPSPWGEGFPGWHIECSAMSIAELGDNFDIHTGGIDHITKHHPNEIAQNRAFADHKVVNYWIHNEFLVVGGTGRMGKSEGNFITLNTLKEKGFDPMSYRYLLLGVSYRQKIDFSFEALEGAEKAYKKLINFLSDYKDGGEVIGEYQEKFLSYINDDLSTPKVLSLIWELTKDSKYSYEDKVKTIVNFDNVLGLNLRDKIKESDDIPQEIIDLAEERKKVRSEKDWSKSDQIRDKIREMGYEIKDTDEGYDLKKK